MLKQTKQYTYDYYMVVKEFQAITNIQLLLYVTLSQLEASLDYKET